MFRDVTIDAGLVRLRNLRIEDAESMYRSLSSEQVLRFLPPSDRGTYEEYVRCLNWQIRCYDTNMPERIEKFVLAMELKSESRPIGCCGLGPWEPDESKVELFYMLDPAFWNRGIATSVARALLRYGLDIVGLPEVVAGVNPANIASERVLQKIGLRYRGTMLDVPRGAEFYIGEHWYSSSRSGDASSQV